MSHVTTHVLDAALGKPAAGISVRLFDELLIASGTTDVDGRVAQLGPEMLPAGPYRIEFDTAEYFGETPHFYPLVIINFTITDNSHYHVPLLLSPFAYSTYRGS